MASRRCLGCWALTLASGACSSPSATGSDSSGSYGSEQALPSEATTRVVIDGEPALGSTASIRLAVVEQLDGSAERWLGYTTTLEEPAVQVALSIGPIEEEAGQAVLQEDAESIISLRGQAYEVLQGTIDYRAEATHAELQLNGMASSTLDGSERSVSMRVSGELWRPCFYRGYAPGAPVAKDAAGNPSAPDAILDEAWSSEFCQAQLRE